MYKRKKKAVRKPQRYSEEIWAQQFMIKTLKLFSLKGRRERRWCVEKLFAEKALAFQPGFQPPEATMKRVPWISFSSFYWSPLVVPIGQTWTEVRGLEKEAEQCMLSASQNSGQGGRQTSRAGKVLSTPGIIMMICSTLSFLLLVALSKLLYFSNAHSINMYFLTGSVKLIK